VKFARELGSDVRLLDCDVEEPNGHLFLEGIEDKARRTGARMAGRVRYNRSVTLAQMQERAVVETEALSVKDIRHVWNQVGRHGSYGGGHAEPHPADCCTEN
jgi:hypothetical protein